MKELLKLSREVGFESKIWTSEHFWSIKMLADERDNLLMCELQNWLRYNHKIIVELTFQMCSKGWEYSVFKSTDNLETEDDMCRIVGSKSYSQAIERGLTKACNLISI